MSKNDLEEYSGGLLWRKEEDKSILLGVTELAIETTGMIAGLDLSEAGDDYSAGDWLGEIRGNNGTVEILAPFDLTILDRNEDAVKDPSYLEDDPTGDAWLLRTEKR